MPQYNGDYQSDPPQEHAERLLRDQGMLLRTATPAGAITRVLQTAEFNDVEPHVCARKLSNGLRGFGGFLRSVLSCCGTSKLECLQLSATNRVKRAEDVDRNPKGSGASASPRMATLYIERSSRLGLKQFCPSCRMNRIVSRVCSVALIGAQLWCLISVFRWTNM